MNPQEIFFKTFVCPNRLKMLVSLAARPGTLSHVSERTNIDSLLVSTHMRKMRREKIIKSEGIGKNQVYSLNIKYTRHKDSVTFHGPKVSVTIDIRDCATWTKSPIC